MRRGRRRGWSDGPPRCSPMRAPGRVPTLAEVWPVRQRVWRAYEALRQRDPARAEGARARGRTATRRRWPRRGIGEDDALLVPSICRRRGRDRSAVLDAAGAHGAARSRRLRPERDPVPGHRHDRAAGDADAGRARHLQGPGSARLLSADLGRAGRARRGRPRACRRRRHGGGGALHRLRGAALDRTLPRLARAAAAAASRVARPVDRGADRGSARSSSGPCASCSTWACDVSG